MESTVSLVDVLVIYHRPYCLSICFIITAFCDVYYTLLWTTSIE